MKVTAKEILRETKGTLITRLVIHAPAIAQKVKPGQFVVLMVNAQGERVPLTVVDKDSVKGEITLIFQELGFTTRLLSQVKAGDSLYALTGPLGHPTEIKKYGRVILVGGGVGIAEIYPVARALKEAGNEVFTVLGARTKDLLILEKELTTSSDKVLIATDDGSYGKKGFVTDILSELLTRDPRPATTAGSPERSRGTIDLIYAVGPIPMMRCVSQVAKDCKVKTIVSLNALMVDATGMCGCCRVTVDGKTKFSCVDGPEFDGGLVDWDEFAKRNQVYAEQEKHICTLNPVS